MDSAMTRAEDAELRGYARRLDVQWGEDAYHTAVCERLARSSGPALRNPLAFYRVAIRFALYKIFRAMKNEAVRQMAWLHDEPVPMQRGLPLGRLPHETCRRGHRLSEENVAYIGTRRTCRTCKRERERLAARARRNVAPAATSGLVVQ
jgi:hypothetical protein